MSFRAVLFDLDGTLYRGNEVIDGAVPAVQRLVDAGVRVAYVTNNSTQTRQIFSEKLSRMGFLCTPELVYGTAYGAAREAARRGFSRIAVVGEPGLKESLAEAGTEIVDFDDRPEAVIVGLCRTFTYDLMKAAMAAIRSGAFFIATNEDATFPIEGGGFIPGAGSVVAAIKTCSQTEPFVVGKPNPNLIQLAISELGVSAAETLVVGDRLDTDIEAGIRAGCAVHLVLTGVESEAPDGVPFSQDVAALVDKLL